MVTLFHVGQKLQISSKSDCALFQMFDVLHDNTHNEVVPRNAVTHREALSASFRKHPRLCDDPEIVMFQELCRVLVGIQETNLDGDHLGIRRW